MKIFTINLTVDTKTTDLYDQVAVNKYPVIVMCNDEKELWEKLSSKSTVDWVRHNIRIQRIFDTAYFHIRELDGDKVNDLCWKVDSLMKITY